MAVYIPDKTVQKQISTGVDSQGRPTIGANGCSADIEEVHVSLHGGASWLYSIFDSQISHFVKGQMTDVVSIHNTLVSLECFFAQWLPQPETVNIRCYQRLSTHLTYS